MSSYDISKNDIYFYNIWLILKALHTALPSPEKGHSSLSVSSQPTPSGNLDNSQKVQKSFCHRQLSKPRYFPKVGFFCPFSWAAIARKPPTMCCALVLEFCFNITNHFGWVSSALRLVVKGNRPATILQGFASTASAMGLIQGTYFDSAKGHADHLVNHLASSWQCLDK